MPDKISGGCACGAIRYECTAEPVFAAHCQCRACQHFSGTGHFSVMAVPKAAVTLTGTPKFYEAKGDSGNTLSRGFCPTCGSPVFGLTTGMPDMAVLPAGSLDDPSVFKPSVVVFTEHGPAWDYLDPALPKFPQMPPAAPPR